MLLIENTSGGDLEINDLGIYLQVGATVNLSLEADTADIAASSVVGGDLHGVITAGNVLVKDPSDTSVNLSLTDSIATVQSVATPHFRMPIGAKIIDALDVDISVDGLMRFNPTTNMFESTSSSDVATMIEGDLDLGNISGTYSHADLIGLTSGDPHTQYVKKAGDSISGQIDMTNGADIVAGIDSAIIADKGTQATPSIKFGTAETGFYLTSNDKLGMVVDGTEKITLSDTTTIDVTINGEISIKDYQASRYDGVSDKGLFVTSSGRVQHGRIISGSGDPTNLFPNGSRLDNDIWPYKTSDGFSLSTDKSPTADNTIEISGTGNLTLVDFFDDDLRFPISSLRQLIEYVSTTEATLKSVSSPTDDVRFFTGFSFYDVEGKSIQWYHSQFIEESITKLTAPLDVGDTTVEVEDASGWVVGANNYVVGANYVDANGYGWGVRGYSRNVSTASSITAINGNVLTLSAPYAGTPMASGTDVRSARPNGGSFRYIGWDGNILTPDTWETRTQILNRPTMFNDNDIGAGKSILSGAATAAPIILVRPTSQTTQWTIGIGKWDVRSVKADEFPDTSGLTYVSDEHEYGYKESRTIDLSSLNGDYKSVLIQDTNMVTIPNEQLVSDQGMIGVSPWEPLNRSTLENGINDGSFSGWVYNDSAVGNNIGWIIGIDLGTQTPVSKLIRYDSTSYYDREWEVVGANQADASDAVVLGTASQLLRAISPYPTEVTFSAASYRYIGCRVVKPSNPSLSSFAEIEVYGGATLPPTTAGLEYGKDYKYSISSTGIMTLTNLVGDGKTIRVTVGGKP